MIFFFILIMVCCVYSDIRILMRTHSIPFSERKLKERKRVVLNGNASGFKYISAGVPQGSILGPFFVLNLY